MRSIPLLAAMGFAALAVPALGQTGVEIHTGANGQLSGSATAGSSSSTVTTGNGVETRSWDESSRPDSGRNGGRAGCSDGNRSRSMRVVSPDGSSSSSVSVSGGTVAVGGSGSPGSRISEEGCPDGVVASPRATERPATPHRTYARRSRRHTTRHR